MTIDNTVAECKHLRNRVLDEELYVGLKWTHIKSRFYWVRCLDCKIGYLHETKEKYIKDQVIENDQYSMSEGL